MNENISLKIDTKFPEFRKICAVIKAKYEFWNEVITYLEDFFFSDKLKRNFKNKM